MKWEYRFEMLSLLSGHEGHHSHDELGPLRVTEQDLNELGADGWEVIAIIPKTGKDDDWTLALLKRPMNPDWKL